MEELPNPEREQSREEIETLLKEALEKNLIVDLVIEDMIENQPNMMVDSIDKDVVFLSCTDMDEESGVGYNVPLPIDRVRKVTMKGPLRRSTDDK